MADLRAKMFNRRASGQQFKPDAVIQTLNLGPGQIVADIGSGGGYFSFRFAHIVGKDGKVYAVDVNPKLLDYVRKQGIEMGLSNLSATLIDSFHSSIPKASLSLVFVRNVYHHLTDPISYFVEMRKRLRPDGRVVIIDYQENAGFSFHSLFKHSISAEKVQKEMTEAGYKLEHSYDFLPEQYFLIFKTSATT